jgi:hypothetical protein
VSDEWGPQEFDDEALDVHDKAWLIAKEQADENLKAEKWLRAQRHARRALDQEELEHDLAAGAFAAEYLDARDLHELPTPDPLIDGVINRHTFGLLIGRDHTWKTFVGIDWAACLATGRPWQGRAVDRVKGLYVVGEGVYGIQARVDAWERAWRTPIERGWLTLRRSAINLFRGGAPLDELLDRVHTGGYGFVVLDTLRRVSGGADGNSSDMGVVVDNIDRIKRATLDGSVFAIAHTDKGDHDTRGFSGIEDDADTVWHAKREDNRLELTNTKMKDGPDGRVFLLRAVPHYDSLILEGGTHAPADDLEKSDQTILDALHDIAPGTATRAELGRITSLNTSTLYRAVGRLLRAGQITDVGVGKVIVLAANSHPLVGIDGNAQEPADLHVSHPSHDFPPPIPTLSHLPPGSLDPGRVRREEKR